MQIKSSTQRLINQVGGIAHGLLNITNSDFMNVQLIILSLEEQNRTAKALLAFDKEIELLKDQEVELKKTKARTNAKVTRW